MRGSDAGSVGPGHRVADLGVDHGLDAGDDVAHVARLEPVAFLQSEPEYAHLGDFVFIAGREEHDGIALLHGAVEDADLHDGALVLVEERIEDERPQRRVRVALRGRDHLDDLFQELVDAGPILRRDQDRHVGVEAEALFYAFLRARDVGAGHVDLVDDREYLQVVVQGEVEVGDGLRLNAL